jgi:hypothetical protein
MNDSSAAKGEVLAMLIGLDPDPLFFHDIHEHFSQSPEILLDVFKRLAAVELKGTFYTMLSA